MKKAIIVLVLSLFYYAAYCQNWGSWQNLDDGWEKNLRGRTQIINPFTDKFIQYEVKNDYKFLVFFTITFDWNNGETGTWEWNLEPGKTKNWIREATGIKKVSVLITKYKGVDGEYHNIGDAVNTSSGSFKLSYEAQTLLKEHYDLIKQSDVLKKIFAAAPFAILFSGGKVEPEDVLTFPWEDYMNACKSVGKILRTKIHEDAKQNCAQAHGGDGKFWCKLAETYEKSE